jgi:hypothetical protein
MKRPLLALGVLAWALSLALVLSRPAWAVSEESLQALGLVPAAMPMEAPDFRLPDLDGGLVTLSDHRGHVVLLNFWVTT